MGADWYSIKQEITSTMANAGFRIYVAIADILGNTQIIDDQLEPYADIIKRSIEINTNFLGIGDYTIPLSSKNLMIFKISEKSIVILYANKGNIAQLLSFKKHIKHFREQIDSLIGDVELPTAIAEAPTAVEVKKVEKALPKQIFGKELPYFFPMLNKKIGDKVKATVAEIRILHLSDGQNSFSDIVIQTQQPAASVFDFLTIQLKKKVIMAGALPLAVECPDCHVAQHLFIPEKELKTVEEPLKLLIRSETCNHEYVLFITRKLKLETQSFKYFTDFQKDKFMKRLGQHFYIVIS